ncbi:translation initiation factor IF-2 subunit alpha [Candidatus Woesearchaeota archaeon]|jgi:translation initiation factor 2 subunit 1|nr:translation initiation factor IF-2 subunit alpha [Candidatus Woesearchaeota archaeon]MBT4321689.1 translation initiation factor IF-2 subunit alpha [Candidatus Woesearchaeota archaeon]MBT4630927.1 translation initiation factor IF-2 subunit alpha [Candidatus Woesearchaeota archaeon]
MFYKKKGMPEEGEIVLCTVKKILYHSVFATIDEYSALEGMLHISEISPGRIRNIRDYVREGKQIVCKVLRIDKEKGHIDLSLRRVNNAQKINKVQDNKSEQKAEKILEFIGKDFGKDLSQMYKELGYALIEKYGSINVSFENFSLDPSQIDELKLTKKLSDLLKKTIEEKIKSPEVEIKEIIELTTDKPNGVEIIKKILAKLQKGEIKILYVGSPKYQVSIKASDYKTAEGLIQQINEDAEKMAEEEEITINFSRGK